VQVKLALPRNQSLSRHCLEQLHVRVGVPEPMCSMSRDPRCGECTTCTARAPDQMRDVLGTIQADQNAIIRAGSRGALVVDDGPRTGKTVVTLQRSPTSSTPTPASATTAAACCSSARAARTWPT
jgi:hypothetical protein